MFGKLLGAAVASLGVLCLLGVGYLMVPDPKLRTAEDRAVNHLARSLNEMADNARNRPRVGWAVIKATSAEHMMVMDVEAERIEEARGIAIQIVEPVKDRYDEILIYVRQPGARVPTVRRIQWTPRGGYTETSYSDR
ncbi:MAG TPA: hypothetical protein VM846_20275 [Vicinamibacterales bacterium]|jgi:hypothetical protein|nr:hypothetical protein [Vicinamibacterales bacterium]